MSKNENLHFNKCYLADPEFVALMNDVETAIAHNVLPERIYQGSSGSYWVKNIQHERLGIFKPKDEEPYGSLNPKWSKWLHRICCPCFFGRTCLVPSQGYLSEAGAYIVDRRLKLNIVPKTFIVALVSETFNYSPIDRTKSRAKRVITRRFPRVSKRFNRIGLPPKIGSLQMFVKNYRDAWEWLRKWEDDPLPPDMERVFQLQLERLVILDYIIRNTDRGDENWLIRYDRPDEENSESSSSPLQESDVKIAAIDNGLAFPFKHPDSWRTYPYHWARIPQARLPFSQETKDLVLSKLSDPTFVQSICDELLDLFRRDRSFNRHTFEKQMSVLRGQVYNVVQALKNDRSPAQLIRMPAVRVQFVQTKQPISIDSKKYKKHDKLSKRDTASKKISKIDLNYKKGKKLSSFSSKANDRPLQSDTSSKKYDKSEKNDSDSKSSGRFRDNSDSACRSDNASVHVHITHSP